MPYTVSDRARAALALLDIEEAEAAQRIDPLERLFNPAFTDVLWEYEHSRIGLYLPGNLHKKQLEFLHNPKQHRHFFAGNQAGKTTAGAIDMDLSALGRHPMQLAGIEPMPPFVGWASALTWDLWEKNMLPELLTWLPVDRIITAPPAHAKSQNRTIYIRADNGAISRIEGKAAAQGAELYQSARINKAWLDEEHPESVWDELQPRLLRFGGRSLSTMTPLKGMTWCYSRVYDPVKRGEAASLDHAVINAGVADNPSIDPAHIEKMKRELKHNPAQLASRLYGEFTRSTGAVYPSFDMQTHGVDLEGDELVRYIASGNCYGGVDFGKWRFAFAWGAVSPDGTLTMIDEVFSQNELMPDRAKRIHKQLQAYGVTDILIYGDCAVPDELRELNQELAKIDSPYLVLPVEMKNKNRAHGVSRVGSLFGRVALRVRRGMGLGITWHRNKSSNSEGHPVTGSRWVWEAQQWSYPVMPDGKVQSDDPDDDSADGADMMDLTRYLSLQWLGPVALETPKKHLPGVQGIIQRDLERLRNNSVESDYYGPPSSS